MIDYGLGPKNSEVEVVIFGPGFGESVVLHVGDQHWMVVDSCIDPHAKRPAALAYLAAIGVPTSQVRSIVASHWHDDHVRGISTVSRECPGAEFHLSAAFNSKEGMAFLAGFSGSTNMGLSRGSIELHAVLTHRDRVWHNQQRSVVLEATICETRTVRVHAISPLHSVLDNMVVQFAARSPLAGRAINNAVEISPNLESVALHVDLGDGDALLLGSDLEDHDLHGWAAIVKDSWCTKRLPATVYKVAHHGSVTGDNPAIWNTLLRPNRTALVTPFNHGRHRLPDQPSRDRIRATATSAYISSSAGNRPHLENDQLKRLGDVARGLKPLNNGFGAVRLRKDVGSASWKVECFGDARSI